MQTTETTPAPRPEPDRLGGIKRALAIAEILERDNLHASASIAYRELGHLILTRADNLATDHFADIEKQLVQGGVVPAARVTEDGDSYTIQRDLAEANVVTVEAVS